MTREEKELALYCLKASSDYHSEVCEECIKYPNCDHMGQDDVTETIIKALEQHPCKDAISRQAAIDAIMCEPTDAHYPSWYAERLEQLPSAQPDIIRCKDCKFYTAMNRKTKSGICSLIMHQNFGDDWYCAGAERRADE